MLAVFTSKTQATAAKMLPKHSSRIKDKFLPEFVSNLKEKSWKCSKQESSEVRHCSWDKSWLWHDTCVCCSYHWHCQLVTVELCEAASAAAAAKYGVTGTGRERHYWSIFPALPPPPPTLLLLFLLLLLTCCHAIYWPGEVSCFNKYSFIDYWY